MGISTRQQGRRDFLKATVATAAGWTIVKPAAVRGSQANSRLDIGVIGCGGRGRFVSRLFEQHTNTKVVALHDYFADRVQKLGDELKVDAGARFTDLDGYKRLVDLKLDAVAVESPPYFHPEQAIAALPEREAPVQAAWARRAQAAARQRRRKGGARSPPAA